jgi:hypothetical protein
MLSETDRINYVNIVLMLASCALAYLFPFHLLFFSYAVLGPAHYLTQISWMHDRRYFAAGRALPYIFVIVTLLAIILPGRLQAIVLLGALFIALVAVLPLSGLQKTVLTALAIAAAAMMSHNQEAMLFATIMLPTVVHIFIFTSAFVLAGALKGHSKSGYASLGVLWLCAASFMFVPQSWYTPGVLPTHAAVAFFIPVSDHMLALLGMESSLRATTALFAFLSFAYTYHYLNWFSKTRIIAWHKIPRARMWGIAACYLAALAVYFHDYVQGFYLLLFLSLLHVVLEFPLNWRVFGTIGTLLTRNLKHTIAR